jgi:predicted site-specific integrase-resolvase
MRDNKLCFTRAEAAAALSVTTWTLDRYIAEGKLPAVRFPSSKHAGEQSRRVLIASADLETFVTQHRTT